MRVTQKEVLMKLIKEKGNCMQHTSLTGMDCRSCPFSALKKKRYTYVCDVQTENEKLIAAIKLYVKRYGKYDLFEEFI